MPKVLSTEKLEVKFSNLTRARDSILGLSSWIMRHSEFCENIVEEWLVGLSKDFNILAMFYVANDVIINCGKKRVPQYRTAFSKVLEKALTLPNVKNIQKEVTRVINIWQERNIYDEAFCESLQNTLNSTEVFEDTPIKSPLLEKEEQSEAEIIANFKQKNLFDKLIKLKYVSEQSREKEEILKYVEEPRKSDFALLGQKECQNLMQKIDKYCETLKTSIKLMEDEVLARNKVLKELKNNTIFYSVQNEDVKKVVHAYRIYGKKIKNVIKNLSIKQETLPSHSKNSPNFSDHDMSSPKSPDDAFHNSPNSCESSQSTFQSPREDQSHVIQDTAADSFVNSFPNDIPIMQSKNKNSFQNLFKKQTANLDKNIVTQSSDSKNSLLYEEKIALVDCSDVIKENVDNAKYKAITDTESSNFMDYRNLISDESKITSNVKSIINKNVANDKTVSSQCHISSKKNKISSLETPENLEDNSTSRTVSPIVNADKSIFLANKSVKSSTATSITSSKDQEKNDNLEDVDELLEKSYRRENIKRKIELLLKTRGNKNSEELNQQPNPKYSSKTKQFMLGNESSEKMDDQNLQSLFEYEKLKSKQTEVLLKEDKKIDTESKQVIKKLKLSDSFEIKCEDKLNVKENKITLDVNTNHCINPLVSNNQNTLNVKNKQNNSEANINYNIESHENSVALTNQISCDAITNISDTCLSISTEQPKNVLDKNENSSSNYDSQHSKETNISEMSPDIDLNSNNDSLFASICSPSISGNYDKIPGLEINQTITKGEVILSKEKYVEMYSKVTPEKVQKEKSKVLGIRNYELKETEKFLEESLSPKSEGSLKINLSQKEHSKEGSVDSQTEPSLKEDYLKLTLENVDKIELNSNMSTVLLDKGSKNSFNLNCDSETNISINSASTVTDTNSRSGLRKLTQTFQEILDYISKHKGKDTQPELQSSLLKQSSNRTLENYLRIYGALQNIPNTPGKIHQVNDEIKIEGQKNQFTSANSFKSVNHNSTVDFCTTTNALQGPILSTCDSKSAPHNLSPPISTQNASSFSTSIGYDNLEVTDMDCDSE